MRIEYLLIVIVSLITLVSVLGLGVAIGGGSEASTAIYINAISAFAACVSSLSALGTLILLNHVRSDWLRPKEHEVKSDFKYALMEWQEVICRMNSYLSSFREHSDIKESVEYTEALLYREKESWSDLTTILNKYMVFFPESSLKSKSLLPINNLRCGVLDCAEQYIAYISKLDCYPKVNTTFSNIYINKEIRGKCSMIVKMV
ncbi:hypothetical protein RAL01_004320 [Vibrio vulnificus]|uniref:hypothetical protein n=1 Tax=Vibrio vulnificus TaxID=672 RepID=UPI001CDD4B07|nr:hypothetical protein [Vibrio vulnificus]EGR0063703.1 hypothetical protein [Vibrio vulnificus]EHU9443776.1 hypothetical protein [Vibrio vulnificus]EIV8497340.1 hypothetical protein [Vibrio vulnificus]EJE8694703.1 hypothetical protein [Vibrio vulnificus]EJN6713575.1 hypothetical protein [Vibrio vulnificus]